MRTGAQAFSERAGETRRPADDAISMGSRYYVLMTPASKGNEDLGRKVEQSQSDKEDSATA